MGLRFDLNVVAKRRISARFGNRIKFSDHLASSLVTVKSELLVVTNARYLEGPATV